MVERDVDGTPIPFGDAEAIAPSTWTTEIGLIAVGGQLTPGRVLSAYASGIFPWPLLGEGEPVLWCSPDPRFVLFPDEFHISKSLARDARRNSRSRDLEFRFDTAFERVIRACGTIHRRGQQGTWITTEMIEVYCDLHTSGHAHSVEAWRGQQLVGGLYGIALGSAFFGESMFTREPNASKLALLFLMTRLGRWRYRLIDCQQATEHLRRFGARELSRERFLVRLSSCVEDPGRPGPWHLEPRTHDPA